MKHPGYRSSLLGVLGSLCLLFGTAASGAPIDPPILQSPDFANASRSDFSASRQVADNFTLTEAHDITDISWWGLYDGGVADDFFTVRIFDDNGANAPVTTTPLSWSDVPSDPNGPHVVRSTNPAGSIGNTDVWLYTLDISSLGWALDPGSNPTDYWLSIVNDTGIWFWVTSDDTQGNGRGRSGDINGTSVWVTEFNQEYAFGIEDNSTDPPITTPIPGTLLLLGPAFALLLARRRLWAVSSR